MLSFFNLFHALCCSFHLIDYKCFFKIFNFFLLETSDICFDSNKDAEIFYVSAVFHFFARRDENVQDFFFKVLELSHCERVFSLSLCQKLRVLATFFHSKRHASCYS